MHQKSEVGVLLGSPLGCVAGLAVIVKIQKEIELPGPENWSSDAGRLREMKSIL